ncbi:related to transforming protein rho [Cephalotrichum gorgonifer]|uniref:Related to transforming protein rho n=1 Tax=Cephalotrichum gorgonifer TaxID=2041049 RepID=A0AAE8MR46_9PEZI|nr:related to transforming protein rho [Cephalotrichum gorgonifer]
MDDIPITIVLIGDDKCGKTSFLSRVSAASGTGPIALLRDIDQPYIFEVSKKGVQYRLEFYDTKSPENWKLLQPDIVIFCYDISQRLTLIHMQRFWINEAKMAFSNRDSLPVLILGLKRDLRSEDDPNGIIYPQEGYQVAQALRADKYMECSAVTGELVDLAFQEICMTAMNTATLRGGQSEGGCSIM